MFETRGCVHIPILWMSSTFVSVFTVLERSSHTYVIKVVVVEWFVKNRRRVEVLRVIIAVHAFWTTNELKRKTERRVGVSTPEIRKVPGVVWIRVEGFNEKRIG